MLGQVSNTFLFQTTFLLCRISFSLSRFHLRHHQRQVKQLPALTNPVFHLLCFYFLNNCKFLNLDLDWKIGFASFVIQGHTTESVAGLGATSGSESLSIHPAPSLPSPLPITVLWPLQGAALSVLRCRHIQLTLNSILAFGDIHVHGSKIKTSFLKAICSTYSLLHGFYAEVGDKLHLKLFPYLLSSLEGKGMTHESANMWQYWITFLVFFFVHEREWCLQLLR